MSRCVKVSFKDSYNSLIHKNRKDIEKAIEEQLEDMPAKSGLFLTDDNENMPVYGPQAGCEKVISRKSGEGYHSGARIVLTKDNYGSRATGVGGAGGSKCEAIDIVAGQLSCEDGIYDGKTKSRSNFATDGARIYMTERGNINHYFATENTDPITARDSNLKSGIGIKSDQTLIIGREKVRILAGFGKFNGGEMLSNGNCDITPVIELGTTSEDNYQPAVRGGNLVRYLYEVSDYISELAAKVSRLENDMALYKVALAGHIHIVAGFGPSTPSPTAVVKAVDGVRGLFSEKLGSIVEEFHKSKENRQYLGAPTVGLKGTKEDYILSNTVFIGR
tara:strand:+ start:5371 stop:6369 length:999 start_codon:yes stop_codon:yes gene_type:complete